MGNVVSHRFHDIIDGGFSFVNIFKTRYRAPPVRGDSLVLKSATELAEMIRTRNKTCVEVMTDFINRILEVNPRLNCVVRENGNRGLNEALCQATLYDIVYASKSEEWLKKNKPFLGVPFTCKEAFASQGHPNRSGMVALKDLIADTDAPVIANMKAAGCIHVGVTVVPEMCMWWETSNNNDGTTNNPYDTRRMVGGSSGGEACAVSSAASVWGVGSDIGGSIRMPAFFNGVYGHKPSPHQVSNVGQFPGDERDDDILATGPICSHWEDIIPMLKIMVGEEKAEKLRLDEKVNFEDLNLKVYSVESIANASTVSPVCDELKSAQKEVENTLREKQGAVILPTSFKWFDDTFNIWSCTLASTGSPPNCERLSTGLANPFSPSTELIKKICHPIPFIDKSNHTLPAIILGLIEQSDSMSPEKKEEYVGKGKRLRQEIVELLGDNGVLLLPSGPKNGYYHHQAKTHPFNCVYTMIGNVLGLPITQVPLGLDSNGLPLGIQVIAGPNNDRLSIAVAGVLAETFGGWKPPMDVV